MKTNNLLPLLTGYLLQHRQLVIPHIGCFSISRKPPGHDIASKQMSPFIFEASLTAGDRLPDRQFDFLIAAGVGLSALSEFGKWLRYRSSGDGFTWNGVGILRTHGQLVVLESFPIIPSGWQAVPAEKVLRSGAEYSHRVGDREMRSSEVTSVLKRKIRLRRLAGIKTGWIILAILAALVLAWTIFHDFSPHSTGLR